MAGSAAPTASRCPSWTRSPSSTNHSPPPTPRTPTAADAKAAHRRIANRAQSVGHDATLEPTLLRPLPGEAFPTWLTLTPRVDRYARVTVSQAQYSVPTRLIGRQVRVQLGASMVTVFDGPRQVAVHERIIARGGQSLIFDHYLEVLARKPGALPGATALAQARAAGTFTPAHDAFWAMARSKLGDGVGTRALVEVLLLHRHLTAADVGTGLTAALRLQSPSSEVVALEARKADVRPDTGPVPFSLALKRRAPIDHGRLGQPDHPVVVLPTDPRPLPTVHQYDQLLTHRTETEAQAI